MKRFTAVALLLAGVALPCSAQRGGGHGGGAGGFSGHSGFHGGGFTASAPSHFSGGGFGNAPRFGSPSFRLAPPSSRAGFGASNMRPAYSPNSFSRRPPYNGSGRSRRVYRWRNGVGFYSVVPGWIGPGYLGYPYDSGYDDSGYDDSSAASAAPAYDMQPAEQDESEARNPYYPSGPSYPPGPAYPSGSSNLPPQNEDAVTVVFKDGRPQEEIHNYALTRSMLYVLDQHPRDIPVDEIDLQATEKVNRDAGVNFQLPGASR